MSIRQVETSVKEESMKSLAFILDGEIVEIIQYDDRMAAILLSNPIIVDISRNHVSKNWKFDGENFTAIVDGEEVVVPADRNTE